MTRDEILNMPAGREMDALIAVAIGWVIEDVTAISPSGSKWARNVHGDDAWLPYYSTDIAAAWEVVVEFNNECTLNNVHGIWGVHFHGGVGESKSAPLAICRAALLAVMED